MMSYHQFNDGNMGTSGMASNKGIQEIDMEIGIVALIVLEIPF